MSGLNSTKLELSAEYNQYTFHYRIPALIFLFLLFPLGILGNASTIYIYGFRLKKSNVHFFITLLAVSDIISCIVCIPMHIYCIFVLYDYTSLALCKAETFSVFAYYICSMSILLVISVERYLKVCRSLGKQVSRKMAKILSGVIFFVSLLIAGPVPFIVGIHPRKVNDDTFVWRCIYNGKLVYSVYCVVFFTLLCCFFGIMSTLYWRVLKTTRSHVAWSQQRRAQTCADAINHGTQPPMSVAETNLLNQTNRTVIWISVVYAASCIPTFIVSMMWTLIYVDRDTNIEYVTLLMEQSWALNCTLNPVVYGFFNSTFRTELRELVSLNLTRTNLFSAEKSVESNPSGSIATL